MRNIFFFFFFQAEDGIRDGHVTGVQTCALPIFTAGVSADGKLVLAREGWVRGGWLLKTRGLMSLAPSQREVLRVLLCGVRGDSQVAARLTPVAEVAG